MYLYKSIYGYPGFTLTPKRLSASVKNAQQVYRVIAVSNELRPEF